MLFIESAFQYEPKYPSMAEKFSFKKIDPQIAFGILGITLIFLGVFVLIIGIALTVYSGHFEQGITVIVLSIILFIAGLFAILWSTERIKLPHF